MNTPRRLGCAFACAWLLAGIHALAAPVDFARDIQPLLEQHCYECHGPKKQQNGYRLDRRSTAFSGLVRHNIVAGSSQTSRVYNRVVDAQFGTRMPPKEPLADDEIELIRRWIDAGAEWPDALANESAPPPLDADAVEFVNRLRVAGRPEELRALRNEFEHNPNLLNARGPGGATPLMFIALYGDAQLLDAALTAGGDARAHNDAGVSALHWAIDDVAKSRLLLDRGAPADAASGIGRTPLTLAAELPGGAEVVSLLLERGAQPTQAALNAAARGNPAALRALLAAGAKDQGDAADMAIRVNCSACLAELGNTGAAVPKALLDVLPIGGPGNPQTVIDALAHGGDVNALDSKGRSPLLLAAISESITPDLLQEFIRRGAKLQRRSADGRNALDHALRVGRQPIIEVFTRAGLIATRATPPAPAYVTGNTARAAVTRALPLLQRSGSTSYARSGCVSCHNNLMTAMTVATARTRGFAVDEARVREADAIMATDLAAMREQSLQGVFAPGGGATTTGYLLMAVAASGQRADLSTDALVRLLRRSQRSDGHWRTVVRPPLEASEFTATAVSLRGLQLFGDAGDAENRDAIAAARQWLESSAPVNTEDHVYRLFGLAWADSPAAQRRAAITQLLGLQRADGGWAQLPSRSSDAYATGAALMALATAGSANTAAWRRGVRFLLDTQLADGSWLVRSRAQPSQSYFESGFPHGEDQFISAAATNWATQVLMLAAR